MPLSGMACIAMFSEPWSYKRWGSTIACALVTGGAAFGMRRIYSKASRSVPVRLSPDKAAHRTWMRSMRAFIFDIDGVVYTGTGSIDGAAEALDALRRAGKTVIFMTNNATKSPEDVVANFRKHGARVQPEEVMTSAVAAADYLKAKGLQGSRVYVVGVSALTTALCARAGVVPFGAEEDKGKTREDAIKEFLPEMEPPASDVAAVVVGADLNFNYYKLMRAANYLRLNPACLFVATNPDPRALLGSGVIVPAAGSMVEAVAVAAGRQPDIICGKPSPSLARHLLSYNGLSASTTCMVGDRTDTDIEFGRSVGMYTLFVESGTMTETEARASEPCRQPHFIAASIAVLADLVEG